MKSHERIHELRNDKIVLFDPTDYSGEQRKEGESDKTYFARLGFDYTHPNDTLTWFRRVRGEGAEYLAVWWEVNETVFIFVRNWPDLLKLRTLVAPVLQTQYQQQMVTIESGRRAEERRK